MVETLEQVKTDLACPKGHDGCPIYEDISELKNEVAELKEQLKTDSLTGLFNKAQLLQSLETEMERTRRSLQPTSLIMFDADHFKQVNDNFGHLAGDKVLKALARTTMNVTRRLDICCRYGGEEFAIVLPTTPTLTAKLVAERIRQSIEALVVELDDKNQTLQITASLGLASFNNEKNLEVDSFIERADQALYKAKQSGRNRVCVYLSKEQNEISVSAAERSALFDQLSPEHDEPQS